MNLLLKIVNEPKSQMPFRVIGDASSQERRFDWNEAVSAYCYAPRSQREVDDLVSLNWTMTNFPWRIAPVMMDGNGRVDAPTVTAASVSRIPPYVRPELYDNYPVMDLQMMCANESIIPEGDPSDNENLKRQLHRYYEGRAWGVEEVRRCKEEVSQLRAKLAQYEAAPPAPAAPAPEPVREVTVTGTDRAAKARAARSANAAKRREARALEVA